MRLIDTAKERLAATRARLPWLDHAVRTQQLYGRSGAAQQAGAVTYFGFLSVFPILALAFFVVGWLARIYPGASQDLTDAIDQVLPGLVGPGEGRIALGTFQDAANTVGLVGVLGILYAGLGWISSMRTALVAVFEIPPADAPNMIVGKLVDLLTLMVLGAVLFASVGLTGAVRGLSTRVLDWIGLGSEAGWALWLLALVLGLAANATLFFVMFRLLASPPARPRELWSGALLGAIGFEALKNLAVYLLGAARGQPAFQVFGISLILLVWISYFSRVTLYAAAWAHTAGPGSAPGLAPGLAPGSAAAPAPPRHR